MALSLKNYTIILLTLIAFSCNSKGQSKLQSSSISQESDVVMYDSGDVVTHGFLDKKGNMWFTTLKEGVFQYNGKTFTRFTEEDGLCGSQVSAIIEDVQGLMWFGTAKGLCSYDGKTFKHIPLPKNEPSSDWLEKYYPIINPDGILSLIQDKNGIFWIGTNGGGVYSYDGSTFSSFIKNEGKLMPDSLYHNVIMSIIVDGNGDIWFSSFSHGSVTKYDGIELTTYGTEDGLKDDMINSSYIDRSGNLWFGTRSGGMSRFDGKRFTTIHETSGKCANHMATLFEDRQDRMWMGSFARSGVCLFDGHNLIPFEVEGSSYLQDIRTISEDKEGNIWFGGRQGILWRYDGKVLTDFTQLKRQNN